MILVVTVVIPQLKGIFTESGSQLPFITRALMGVGDFLLNWGVAIIVFLIIAIFLFIRYIKTPEGKAFWQQLLLSLPIVGPIQKKVAISRFASSCGALLKGGLPIASSLEISGKIVSNVVYEEILTKTADAIRSGGTISDF